MEVMTDTVESGYCEVPVEQLILTFHALYNLPQSFQYLDPQEELLEVVIWPVVTYDYNECRLTRLSLGEHVMQFSPSLIVSNKSRIVMDVIKENREQLSILCDKFAGLLTSSAITITDGEGKMLNGNAEKGKNVGSSNTYNECMAKGKCISNIATNKGCHGNENTNYNENVLLLQWPYLPALRTHIDVTVGVRYRKKGSYTVQWLTKKPDKQNNVDNNGIFSVAVEEVYRKKYIARVLGLTVGGAIFSFSVSPTDTRERIIARLLEDKRRCCAASHNSALEDIDVVNMLRSGSSEQEIYRHMLLLADPNYYYRRLESTLMLYKSCEGAQLSRYGALLNKFAFREEELMRRVAMEVGPECRSVSLRHRLLAFREKYRLSEQHIFNCLQSVIGEKIYEKLMTEPEETFDILKEKFGEEPLPTSYLLSVWNHVPERRTFFLDTLHSLVKHWTQEEKDENRQGTVRLCNLRPPFIASPCERPLHFDYPASRSGEQIGEVETLREKYAPEFEQIVPFIADVLRMVVEKNRMLCDYGSVNSMFAVFQQHIAEPEILLQEVVKRTARDTFISPSSMLGAIIYLDRLCFCYSELVISELNVFRLFVTSVRVASKVLELRSVSNAHFAEVFGLDIRLMNILEEVFVKYLQFDLFLSSAAFREYASTLQSLNACNPDVFFPPCRDLESVGNNKEDATHGVPHCDMKNTEVFDKSGDSSQLLKIREENCVVNCCMECAKDVASAAVSPSAARTNNDAGLSEHDASSGVTPRKMC